MHFEPLMGIVALLGAFAVGRVLTPAIIRLAQRRQLFDVPSEARHVHTRPIPRLGGVAVVASTIVGTVAALLLTGVLSAEISGDLAHIGALTAGAAIVFFTGLIDDLRGVPPRMKILAQTTAAIIVLSSGFAIPYISVSPGSIAIPLHFLSPVLIVLWVVGMTNAFNLIDGVDGLAGTFALLAIACSVGVETVAMGRAPSLTALALAGGILAFLRFNNSPARVFLGDAGSMTLGFFLAIHTLRAATDESGTMYPLVPLFVLAFPILDTLIAIARRWIRGEPLSRADGRHIHHQLLALGISPTRTVELLGFFFAAVAMLGIAASFAPPRLTVAMVGATMTVLFSVFWYALRVLRYNEFAELGASIVSVVRNARLAVQEKVRASEVANRLGSATTIDEVKTIVAQLVDETDLLDIEVLPTNEHLHAHGPERQRISPVDALPVHLDYPFAWESRSGIREMVLRIWYRRPQAYGQHTAERVAIRLAPALESWFRETYGADSSLELDVDGLKPARASGVERNLPS